MRLIDADKLKAHYAWWGDTELGRERKEVFDEIVDQQPTIAAPSKPPIGAWQVTLDAYVCPICGFETNNPNKLPDGPEWCPACHCCMS